MHCAICVLRPDFSDLRFEISVKDCMVWKPSAVQLRNVKNKNCGSYFEAGVIRDSPVVEQAIGHGGTYSNFLKPW